jgi:hypothetical protein
MKHEIGENMAALIAIALTFAFIIVLAMVVR